MRSEVIEGLLDEGATADAGATAVAGATVEVLTLLLVEIKPLIGTSALRALYVRSRHLANASFEPPGAQLATDVGHRFQLGMPR